MGQGQLRQSKTPRGDHVLRVALLHIGIRTVEAIGLTSL
jgi:hypothetical protein